MFEHTIEYWNDYRQEGEEVFEFSDNFYELVEYLETLGDEWNSECEPESEITDYEVGKSVMEICGIRSQVPEYDKIDITPEMVFAMFCQLC